MRAAGTLQMGMARMNGMAMLGEPSTVGLQDAPRAGTRLGSMALELRLFVLLLNAAGRHRPPSP